MNVIRTVLHALQMRLAPSPLVALASLSWRRARIRWRGLAFVARDPDHIPVDSLLRIDTCWSVTTGLTMVDSIRAVDFNARHLLLALDAGEPYRIARALALEALFLASRGAGVRRAAQCAERAASVAKQSGRPHAEALSALTAGMSAFLAGEWKKTSVLCERALVVLREQCTGATWETNCAESFLLYALLFQGESDRLHPRPRVREKRARPEESEIAVRERAKHSRHAPRVMFWLCHHSSFMNPLRTWSSGLQKKLAKTDSFRL